MVDLVDHLPFGIVKDKPSLDEGYLSLFLQVCAIDAIYAFMWS